jgi:aminomethyltransferase
MAPFAGWSMPLEYAGGGVAAEHGAVRSRVGIFDASHLGTATVRGPGAVRALNRLFTADLDKVSAGQAQYTLLCASDGGVIDDLIAYRRSDDDVLLIPNAANSAAVLDEVRSAAPECDVADLHRDVAIVAVQGPLSVDVLDAVGLPSTLPYMSFVDARQMLGGREAVVTVCRTGYTGEHGFELLVQAASVLPLWDALLAAVTERGGRPCGLASRDTLRTEMGYPLHGQDLGHGITPVQAGLDWAVGWTKDRFAGRDALMAERAAGPTRRLRGLRATGRGVPRPGMTVLGGNEKALGEVTSGTFSPTLGTGIALALLDPSVEPDSEVVIDARGRPLPAVVVTPPFVDASPR